MDPIVLTSLTVQPFELPNEVDWRFQVMVIGGPFPRMGTLLEGRLGDQRLEGVHVSPDGQGFGGYLKDPPQDGDRLFFSYAGLEEVETELVYREPVA